MAIVLNLHQETSLHKKRSLDCSVEFLQSINNSLLESNSKCHSIPCDVYSLEIIKNMIKNEPSYSDIGLRKYSDWYNSRTREAIVMYVDSLHLQHKATIQALFLAISYIDTILSTYEQKPPQLTVELIAACCFILAMKTNETDLYFTYSDYLFPSFDRKYTLKPDDLFNMEIQCIQKLKYELNLLTVYEMMSILLTIHIPSKEEIRKCKGSNSEIYSLCHTIAHKALYKGCVMLKYSTVQISFSILYTAKFIKGTDIHTYNHLYEKYFEYSIKDYEQCISDILT